MQPPLTQNYIEYSYLFDMPEAGPHELVMTGLGVQGNKILDENGHVRADISTMVDGVSLVREEASPVAKMSDTQVFPKGAHVTIAAGARLALDVPGQYAVDSLTLGGRRVEGLVSASTHPKYLSGVGVLDVKPRAAHPVKILRK